MTKVYQQAFTEAYEILNYLNEEDYNKIPKNIIRALEKNRDIQYSFFIDESIPFCEQDILEETKAILFNLYRDYLVNSSTKNKIIKYPKEEINELEKIKKYKYPSKDIFNRNSFQNNTIEFTEDNKSSMIKYKVSILEKIFKQIKKILWKK